MVKGQEKKKFCFFLVGLTFIVLGIVMIQYWEPLIRTILNNQLSLHPNSIAFNRWKYTKNPSLLKAYFFNWTNPDQISEENYKPSFTEMGPYAFKVFRRKVNISFNDNGTISYRTILYWHFDEENSNGSLTDNITSVNVIAATVSYMTKTWSRAFLYPLSMFLASNGQKISYTKNVREVLLDGFDNPILNIRTYVPGYDGPDKFAWFYNRNGTPLEYFLNVDTGVKNISNIGKLYFVNYQNKSDIYPDCSDITGSAGEFYPPNLNKGEPLKVFSYFICRKMIHYFVGESTYKGLTTYLYSGTKETVDNGSLVDEVKCYYKKNDCPRAGVFDARECQKAPLFVSHPHFITADPYYRDSVEGMNPDPSKHISYQSLEPITGLQIHVSVKYQINIFITRNPGISIFRKVPDLYIPVMWFDTEDKIGGIYLFAITAAVIAVKFGSYFWYMITVLGFLIEIAVALYHFKNCNFWKSKINFKCQKNEKEALRKAEEQNLSNNEENGLETEKFVIPENKAEILGCNGQNEKFRKFKGISRIK